MTKAEKTRYWLAGILAGMAFFAPLIIAGINYLTAKINAARINCGSFEVTFDGVDFSVSIILLLSGLFVVLKIDEILIAWLGKKR